MSNSDILLEQLRAAPDDDFLAGLLLDARAEEADVDPDTVRAWVEHERQTARDARDRAGAALHLRVGSNYRTRLHRRIRSVCDLEDGEPMTVVVVDGDEIAVTAPDVNHLGNHYWPDRTVLVGARRVMMYVESIIYEEEHNITEQVEQLERDL